MSSYYKKFEKSDYYFENAPVAYTKSYEVLKKKEGVIVQGEGDNEFLLVPTNLVDEFVIACLSRQDMATKGYNGDNLSDNDMENIASDLGEDYIGYGSYWDLLCDKCEEYGLVRDPNFEEEDDSQ